MSLPSLLRTLPLVIGHWTLVISVTAALAAAAERIVTLGGALTETVFALGAGDQVVARDTSSVYPASVHALPDVGYFRMIGAEGVLAQQPTLILAATGTGPDAQVELLKNSGVRFLHLAARPGAESTLEMIHEVGAATGRTAEADALAARLRTQFAEANALAARTTRAPRVVIFMSAGPGSLIQLAGGVNPFTGNVGYKTTSAEELILADPDFIFVATRDPGEATGAAFAPYAATQPWLASTRAAQAGHLLAMDMTLYLVFGPRSGDAVLAFAQTIHADS